MRSMTVLSEAVTILREKGYAAGATNEFDRTVTVIAWWATSFVPPEPKSTSRVILDEELPAGAHTIAIPAEVPAQASFRHRVHRSGRPRIHRRAHAERDDPGSLP